MKNRLDPFKEKISITVTSKDSARKKPFCFVIRKISLILTCLVFFGVIGISAYAGISAYLSVEKLSGSIADLAVLVQQNTDMIVMADRIDDDTVLAMARSSADGEMPSIAGDEIIADETGDIARLSDPWLTVESAPVVETTTYENGSINGRVELIDWFNGGSELYSKQTEAVVIDVATGLSFHVRRFGGEYHGDSDPLTAEDTAILKQIVGGEWTWDRHPIWLKIGDRYIAASMNGMPHMADPSPGNDFGGHFCIHFLHSMVHETGAECPRHQACVMEAFASADKLEEYLQSNQY